MEIKKINIDDWVPFGEGGVAKTFVSRIGDGTFVLKLNQEGWDMERTYEEYDQSKRVCGTGIPCPRVFDFVTDGKRFGYTSQRIVGKKSYSRLLADHPEQIDQLAADFAAKTRELHATKCDTTLFPNLVDVYKSYIDKSDVFPPDVRMRLQECYEMRDTTATTCVHGDLQMGNLIRAYGKDYWIDLGSFGYGDPLADIANMMLIGHLFPPQMVKRIFHNPRKRFNEFTEKFILAYFGGEPGQEVRRKIWKLAMLKAGVCVAMKPASAPLFYPAIRGQKGRFLFMRFVSRFAKGKID